MPLRIGCGELSRALVFVIALTAHLLLGASLCLGGPTLVRWQTPFADQSAYSGESAEHRTRSLSRNKRSLCRPYARHETKRKPSRRSVTQMMPGTKRRIHVG